ncbi:MAG: BhlA/UviB family holin-like peptide [Turicibacter sp.]|nr:BhlA/UviB family holin-like peptide [Turicibacter sp.]
MMFELLLENALTYGIFAGLFVWLLHSTSKRNTIREDRYQKTIEKNQSIISEQAKAFSSLSCNVSDIKVMMRGGANYD